MENFTMSSKTVQDELSLSNHDVLWIYVHTQHEAIWTDQLRKKWQVEPLMTADFENSIAGHHQVRQQLILDHRFDSRADFRGANTVGRFADSTKTKRGSRLCRSRRTWSLAAALRRRCCAQSMQEAISAMALESTT
jgi:hypothetical protein